MRKRDAQRVNGFFVGLTVVPAHVPPVDAVLPYLRRIGSLLDCIPGRVDPNKCIATPYSFYIAVEKRFYLDITLAKSGVEVVDGADLSAGIIRWRIQRVEIVKNNIPSRLFPIQPGE